MSVTLNGSQGENPASKAITFGAATCSISPNNPSVQVGNSQQLTASCNFTPSSYAWTGACSGSGASCTVPAQGTTGSVMATLVALDLNGNSATVSDTVTFAAQTGGNIPKTCSDGTSTVVGTTFSALDGTTDSVNITNSQTAVFPFVVPSVVAGAQIKITHFQTNDNTNITPRTGYISQTPCDMPQSNVGKTVPSAQWMFGTGGVATLTAIVDGGNYIDVSRGATPHMKVGDTWYLMFQNRTSSGKGSCTGNCMGNVSVKAQPGS